MSRLGFALFGIGLSFVLSCSAKHDPPPGAILLAIDANLKVPTDIDEIGVSVASADGSVVTTDMIHPMAPAGDARFPATLAILRGTDQPIDIKVAGFKNGVAFALREAVTTIPEGRTALLRMDLNYLDIGSTSGAVTKVQSLATSPPCTSTQTSIAGTCQSFVLESLSLPTYSEDDVVSSTSEACLDVTSCLLGAPAGAMSVPRPTADPNDATSCTLPVPSLGPDFNLAIVPTEGTAGWCDGSGCVVPLSANDATEGWHIEADGLVHLPPAICASTKITSLLLVPSTASCPLYGPVHPACQQYGSGSEGGFDATSGFDGSVPSSGIRAVYAGNTDYKALGVGIDAVSGLAYRFLANDAGTTADEQDNFVLDAGFFGNGAYPLTFVTFDPAANHFAVTSDRFAASSVSGVQLLTLDGGADAGWYPSTTSSPISLAYQATDLGPRLFAAGLNGGLAAIAADGGVTAFNSGSVTPTLLAYDGAQHFIVASTGANQAASFSYETFAGSPALVPFATEADAVIEAVVFADAQTAVWVDDSGHFFVASVNATGGPGAQIPISTGLYAGPQSLTGANGRIAWIGLDQHVYTAHASNGFAYTSYDDLSQLPMSGPSNFSYPNFTLATLVAIDPGTGFLHWTEPGVLFASPLTDLP
jgi:hypothetical protein